MNIQNIIDQIPIILLTGLVSGIGSGILTHYLTSRRSISELKRKNKENQLEKIYTPILQILNSTVIPGDGYEGLQTNHFEKIEKIVEENYQFVDLQLDTLIWSIKEEINWYWRTGLSSHDFILDEDMKLLNHIISKYNSLRKQLYLPYDKKKLFPYNIILKVQRLYYNWRRKRKLLRIRAERSSSQGKT